eukprot:7108361-Pyramimonas_sp.AAC.1
MPPIGGTSCRTARSYSTSHWYESLQTVAGSEVRGTITSRTATLSVRPLGALLVAEHAVPHGHLEISGAPLRWQEE